MSSKADADIRRPRYDEGCAAAFALGVVGDRWALLVVRELMLAPKRFQAIRAGIPGVTPSVLSSRLDELTEAGLVDHDPALGSYALTEAGRALRPILHELGRWGAGRPGHDPHKFLSPTALMLSLAVMVDHDAARRISGTVGFDLGGEKFEVSFDATGEPIQVAVRAASGDAVFVGPANAVGGALYGPAPVSALVAAGALAVRGDMAAAQRFADAFATLG